MAVSESFLSFVLEQLSSVRALTSRRMFGGVGLYAGERFFAVIDNDTLFFRVDDSTRPAYIAAGSGPFAPIPGARPMSGYYQVPASVLEHADDLEAWAARAIAVGGASPKRRRPKAPPAARRVRRVRRPARRR
jgi:DNA transformation protein